MPHPIVQLKRTSMAFARKLRELFNEQATLRREYEHVKHDLALRTPGNPTTFGYKVYSQFDEDGIIAHIFSRLGTGDSTFIEIGCSDGLENNTHALLLQGWRGVWIDADAKKIHFITEHLPASSRLVVKQAFVSAENVNTIVSDALAALDTAAIDFLSLDIDSDDLNVLATLLDRFKPRVICAEYNAKFPPPMKIAIKSCPRQSWVGDDYHGASLGSLCDLLHRRDYRLIACGASGVNAFFVRNCDAGSFPSFTAEQLFQPSMYHLRRLASGFSPSLKFLSDTLEADSDNPTSS